MKNNLKRTTEHQTVWDANGEVKHTKITERTFVYEFSGFVKSVVFFWSFFILALGMILLSRS